jgi:hypothetical protein
MSGVREAINTSNTQQLLLTSSAKIRFISLNLSVSESAIALELRLPLFKNGSYTLQLRKEAIGHESQIGPCVAIHSVDNRPGLYVSENQWRRHKRIWNHHHREEEAVL